MRISRNVVSCFFLASNDSQPGVQHCGGEENLLKLVVRQAELIYGVAALNTSYSP